MLSKEMQDLVSSLGGLVVVENNQPKFVVISYEKYKNLVIHKNIDNSENFDKDGSEEVAERLNKEISALQEQVSEKEKELTISQ